MFYIKRLRRDLLLEAAGLGPRLKQTIISRLMEELEGSSLGKHGFVIKIVEVNESDIKSGIIDNDSGAVNVVIWYTALLFRPFTNEVQDSIVTTTTETGFFCQVGPIQVFVSRHAMAEDMVFDHLKGDCWRSEDGEVLIKEGSLVRLRVMGLSVEAGTISAIGTIKDDFLGLYA